jgi:hypothetical protein
MQAPAQVVYEQINDLKKWEAWSPWAEMDPNQKRDLSGPESGTGAVLHWTGNDQVGEGRMTITDSRPNELIQIKLEFLKPWQAVNTSDFEFKSNSDKSTEVTWTMTGQRNFFMKLFCLFKNMDKMVGGDFEKGLAKLKVLTERT